MKTTLSFMGLLSHAGIALSAVQPVALLAITFLMVIVALDAYDHWRKRRALGSIPLIHDTSLLSRRLRWRKKAIDWEGELEQAYFKYSKNGKPFAFPLGTGWLIVLPVHCGREYYNLPRHEASFMQAVEENLQMASTVDVTWKVPVQAVQACNKTSQLKRLHDTAISQVDHMLRQHLAIPNSGEWHDLNVLESIFPLGCELTIALIFHPGFGKAAGLAHQVVSYFSAFEDRLKLCQEYPQVLRPLLWGVSSSCRTFRKVIARMKKTMVPEIIRRIELAQESKDAAHDPFILDAIVRLALREGSMSKEKYADLIASEVIFLCFEIAGPVSMVITILLFRILRNPEYIPTLREEIAAAQGSVETDYGYDMFNQTPKLESFTKETLRLDGPAVFGGSRQAMTPIDIPSLNMTVAPRTQVTLPARFIHLDPEYYPDAGTFDGYRFYDEASGTYQKPSLFTASETWMAFGIGTSTCPARVMGTRLAQAIFAKILMEFDIEPGKDTGREFPVHIIIDADAVPNPDVGMRVRTRQADERGGKL